ncbi:uncharacterized protein LOC121810692 [Salvia splendens]|uniref:uncharacterized protein LOC121810692 n=1 Tax=Salvia splendens TaxID=180675 RepID=UPI001C25CF04|nr:uncharacterized protein LOC121810692 [Salvia splendens]
MGRIYTYECPLLTHHVIVIERGKYQQTHLQCVIDDFSSFTCCQDGKVLLVIREYYEMQSAGLSGLKYPKGFITPYKGVRYHLKEWGHGTQAPQTTEVLFNLKHSKARNVIERSFAVLKMRWGILRSPNFYPIEVQTGLIIACFLLHNFIRTHMEVDPYEELVGAQHEDGNGSDHDDPVVPTITTVAPTPMWTKKRDDLAAAMWAQRTNV